MIGIIGAMDLEIEPLAEMLCDPVRVKICGMTYISGSLYGKDVVLSICGSGKVLAALCTQIMIHEYSPDMILNIGVAGSTSTELHVYDIAVGDRVVQHDVDITPLGYPLGFLPDLDVVYVPCDELVVAAVKKCLDTLSVNYRVGTIASGDQFIAYDTQKKTINDNFGAIACEMEGASIGTVCYVNKLPFCVIRAISDEANGQSSVDYPTFKVKAGKRSVEIVTEFLKLVE